MLLLTFGVGVGLGFAQALMPAAVKERFALRPAFATGIYVLGFNIGSALSSVFAVPISDATGSWRWSLVVFSALTVALVPAWMWLTRGSPRTSAPTAARIRLPFHSGTAWVLVGIFGSMACVFYGLNSWLPDVYVERGWSDGKAGGSPRRSQHRGAGDDGDHPVAVRPEGLRRVYLVSFSAALALAVAGFVVLPAAPGHGPRWSVSPRARCSRW